MTCSRAHGNSWIVGVLLIGAIVGSGVAALYFSNGLLTASRVPADFLAYLAVSLDALCCLVFVPEVLVALVAPCQKIDHGDEDVSLPKEPDSPHDDDERRYGCVSLPEEPDLPHDDDERRYGCRGSRRHTCGKLSAVGLTLMICYQCANIVYFFALEGLGPSLATCVYQASTTIFVLVFSLLFVATIMHPWKLLAVAGIILGGIVVSLDSWVVSDVQDQGQHANGTAAPGTPSSAFPKLGATTSFALLIVSAGGWALYEVAIAALLPRATLADIVAFMAWRGIWNIVVGGIAMIVRFQLDSAWHSALLAIEAIDYGHVIAMAAISLITSLFVALAIAKTHPLYVRVGSALIVPASFLVDAVEGYHPGFKRYLGSAIVLVSIVVMNLPWPAGAKEEKTTRVGMEESASNLRWPKRVSAIEEGGDVEEEQEEITPLPARRGGSCVRCAARLHCVTKPIVGWRCTLQLWERLRPSVHSVSSQEEALIDGSVN
jgi:hypothetical protein